MPLRFIVFWPLLWLVGCASAPQQPDFAAQVQQELTTVADWQALDQAEPVTYLNDLIASPQVDELVEKALSANPSLQQTLLTLQIRQQERDATQGARLPSVDAGFSAGKSKNNGDNYSASVQVSWELDVWQKLADSAQAAELDVAEQQALTQSTRDTLVAQVMQLWLQLIAQQRTVEIANQRLNTLQRNQDSTEQRFRSGLGTLEALYSARTSTANAQANLLSTRAELDTLQRSLHSVLGQVQPTEIAIPDTYPDVLVSLAKLPEQTLQRRPDLKADFLAIQAADARQRAAYKNLLPSINLQAALSDAASSPTKALFGNPLWSLLGQLSAPIFQGGQLEAAANVAALQLAQRYQAYRETLLTAVTEVEEALAQEQALAEQQQAQEETLALAQQTFEKYQQSYLKGLVEMPDLLSALTQTYDAEAQLNSLIYQRLANRISLGLALGLPARGESL